jgi:hypothetical protein
MRQKPLDYARAFSARQSNPPEKQVRSGRQLKAKAHRQNCMCHGGRRHQKRSAIPCPKMDARFLGTQVARRASERRSEQQTARENAGLKPGSTFKEQKRGRHARQVFRIRTTVIDEDSWIISKHRMSLKTRHKRNPKLVFGMLFLCQVSERRGERPICRKRPSPSQNWT